MIADKTGTDSRKDFQVLRFLWKRRKGGGGKDGHKRGRWSEGIRGRERRNENKKEIKWYLCGPYFGLSAENKII